MKGIQVAALLIVAMASAPRGARAQQTPSRASADAEASAREHFQRGQRLSTRGEYAAAYREFAAGYALTERPLFLFNMGEAARANGDIAKARDNYQRFLEVDPDNALAATARTRLASLDPPPAPTPSSAASSPSAATPAVTAVPFGPNPESPRPIPPPWTAAPAPPRPGPRPAEPIALAPIGSPAPLWKKCDAASGGGGGGAIQIRGKDRLIGGTISPDPVADDIDLSR